MFRQKILSRSIASPALTNSAWAFWLSLVVLPISRHDMPLQILGDDDLVANFNLVDSRDLLKGTFPTGDVKIRLKSSFEKPLVPQGVDCA